MESRRIYGLDEIQAFVSGDHNGKPWAQAKADLTRSLAQHFIERRLTEADYLALNQQIEARTYRHRRANERDQSVTGRIGRDEHQGDGSVHMTRCVGGMMPGLIGHLVPPAVEVPVEWELRPLPGERRRRGPSKFAPEVREKRGVWRRGQAKMAKCPADTFGQYKHAEASALSIVLYDIVEHGECVRPIERIAGAVQVSPRTVQTMLRRAQARGELKVERRALPCGRTIPNRITLIGDEILAYQDWTRGREHPQSVGSQSFFDSDLSYRKGPPFEGANSFTLPHEEEAEKAVESPPEVVAGEPVQSTETGIEAVCEASEPVLGVSVVEHEPEPVPDPVPRDVKEPLPAPPSRYARAHRPVLPDPIGPGAPPVAKLGDAIARLLALVPRSEPSDTT